MIQWVNVPIQTVFNDYTIKLYRPLYVPESKLKIEFKPDYGLDRYAKDHLGSELYNYKIFDTNKISISECLGDLAQIKYLEVPID